VQTKTKALRIRPAGLNPAPTAPAASPVEREPGNTCSSAIIHHPCLAQDLKSTSTKLALSPLRARRQSPCWPDIPVPCGPESLHVVLLPPPSRSPSRNPPYSLGVRSGAPRRDRRRHPAPFPTHEQRSLPSTLHCCTCHRIVAMSSAKAPPIGRPISVCCRLI